MQLTFLSLARNEVTAAPDDFECCSALQSLDVSHNLISGLPLAACPALYFLSLKCVPPPPTRSHAISPLSSHYTHTRLPQIEQVRGAATGH